MGIRARSRMVALGATVAIHLAVGAVVAVGWPRGRSAGTEPHLVSVVVLPQAEPVAPRRPPGGPRTPAARPRPVPVPSSQPPTILLVPPAPLAIEPIVMPSQRAEGGSADPLAVTTQAYRRAIMARLEAQRARMKTHTSDRRRAAGAILFRIERTGRLLQASVAESTGFRTLDRTAMAIVRRAAPFPAIPDELPDELTITLPVEFLAGVGMAAG
ncbi:energy transducer TonB family protein [Novosphingobium gossypii]|uniref:energy transducer TonB family protein n=1 Tax=Novosphingobium gossypii TaxID=1604774 RepID=UPI003D1AE25E